jgi:hypothetical protein
MGSSSGGGYAPYRPDNSHENELLKMMMEQMGGNEDLDQYNAMQAQADSVDTDPANYGAGNATNAMNMAGIKALLQLIANIQKKRAQKKAQGIRAAKFGFLQNALNRRSAEQRSIQGEEARRYEIARQQKDAELGQSARKVDLQQQDLGIKRGYNDMMGRYYQGKLSNDRSIEASREAAQLRAAQLKANAQLGAANAASRAKIAAAGEASRSKIAAARLRGSDAKQPKTQYQTVMDSAAKALSPTDYNKYKQIVDVFGIYPSLKQTKGGYALGKTVSRGQFKDMVISKRRREGKPIPQEYILDNLYDRYQSMIKGTRL